MRTLSVTAVIVVLVALIQVVFLSSSDDSGEPDQVAVEPTALQNTPGGERPESSRPPQSLSGQNDSSGSSAGSDTFDFASIGLPDLSHFELAPGVEEELGAWREAGCIDPGAVKVDGFDQTTRHHADEWLIEEGDMGGLESTVLAAVPQTIGDYGTYSRESLVQLADESNDPRAALALALKFHREGDLWQALDRYEQAIALGYTQPLISMPLLRYRLQALPFAGEAYQAEAEWQYEIERLTSDLIRERRGAPFELSQILDVYIQAHTESLTSGHSWEETWREAQARADNRYATYSNRRRELGLGPFDNSRPPVAVRLDRYAQLHVIGRASDLELCAN
jgi:hypothetical protein